MMVHIIQQTKLLTYLLVVNSATAKVQTVTVGQVDEIIVDDAGTGYAVGDNLVLNNAGTDGSGAVAQVSVVGGGIAPEGRFI